MTVRRGLVQTIELIETAVGSGKLIDKSKTWVYSTIGKLLYGPGDAAGKCDKKTFAGDIYGRRSGVYAAQARGAVLSVRYR